MSFDVGVVITTCAGREENLRRTIRALNELVITIPGQIVIVYDGCEVQDTREIGDLPQHIVSIDKHEPGMEQPRNVGFRHLREVAPGCNYCWFLDSDLVFHPNILQYFEEGLLAVPSCSRILIGPYDWMADGETEPGGALKMADQRWASFNEYGPERVFVSDLGAALANFAGNLVWPAVPFEKIGGFHPELHHGRCEDGELGLRAASAGVPMSFVRDARAWHVAHPEDYTLKTTRNARDIPLLNSWHPWVESEGLVMTAKDGVRFDWRCPDCGQQVNSLEYWPHSAIHRR